MADLSQLSDDQLEVYKDLLTSKQNPSNSIPAVKPPIPTGLQGPPPGRLKTALQNLPGSVLNAVQHPSFPGMPGGMESEQYPHQWDGAPPPKGSSATPGSPEPLGDVQGMIHGFTHPEDDPAGAALALASLGRGVGKYGTATEALSPEGLAETGAGAAKGAYKGATTMVPLRRHGMPVNVPAPLAGAATGGFMGWLSHLPNAPEVGATIGAGAPIVGGGFSGARGALQDIMDRGKPPATSEDFMGPSNMPPTSDQVMEGLGVPNKEPVELPGGQGGSIKKQALKYSPFKEQKLQAHPGIVGGTNPLPDVAPPTDIPPEVNIPGGQLPNVGALTKQLMKFSPNRGGTGGSGSIRVAGRSPWRPPSDPIEAANEDTHPEGTTQGDEFPAAPPPGAQGPGVQASPRVLSPSEIQHQGYTDQKHENIRNFVADPKNGITPEGLQTLRDSITQVDDPIKQAQAIDAAKNLGKAVTNHAARLGNQSSKYGTFNLQDFNVALKHLKALQQQK